MPVIDLTIAVACLALGVWLDRKYGDKLLVWLKGAEAVAASLKAKADAISAAVKK